MKPYIEQVIFELDLLPGSQAIKVKRTAPSSSCPGLINFIKSMKSENHRPEYTACIHGQKVSAKSS